MTKEIAPIPFVILKCFGLWRPADWSSSWRLLMYSIYTVLMLIILVTMAFFVLLAVCYMPFTDDLFAENVFLMFALINATFKAMNVLLSRGRFITMLNMVRDDEWRKHSSLEEQEIRSKYDRTIRKISVYFTSAVFVAIILRVIAPLFEDSDEPKLPVAAYRPCNAEHPKCYWTLYAHQAIGTGVATLIHAAKDSLISALLLQTCSQLAVLKNRLLNVSDICEKARKRKKPMGYIAELESRLIRDCARQHERVFTFARVLNDSLNVMLFGQIATTMPNLCLSIYLLSKQNIGSMEFMMTTQFFSAVVIELFFFCWYGNEVTLNSLDVESAIYEMDWTTLTTASKRDLMTILIRTSKPILFRVGPIMNMNIDSFIKIMKTSYSAFSVLQSTGE